MNRVEIALNKFKEDYNCAQSVLYAFSDTELIDSNTALQISAGFGGGIARNGQACGAFTAGVMLIGLAKGKGIEKNPALKSDVYRIIDQFIDEFTKQNTSINCREILRGCELKTETGRKMFDDNKLEEKYCVTCIETAVNLINNII